MLFAEIQEDFRTSRSFFSAGSTLSPRSSYSVATTAAAELEALPSSTDQPQNPDVSLSLEEEAEWLAQVAAIIAQLQAATQDAKVAACNAKKPQELKQAIACYRELEAEIRHHRGQQRQRQATFTFVSQQARSGFSIDNDSYCEYARQVADADDNAGNLDGLRPTRDLPLLESPQDRQARRHRIDQTREAAVASAPVAVLYLDGRAATVRVAAVEENFDLAGQPATAVSDSCSGDGFIVTVTDSEGEDQAGQTPPLPQGSDCDGVGRAQQIAWTAGGTLELGCITEEEASRWLDCLQHQLQQRKRTRGGGQDS